MDPHINPQTGVWDDNYYAQTHGSGSGGGGYKPLSSPDVAALREQVYNTLKPYYLQLAKEAQGDFDRATKIMEEDYSQGVREQKANYAFIKNKQTEELKNTLSTLGITNLQDQEQLIDKLNQRGAAVYQNNPDGSYNVVKPSQITPNGDNSSVISNPQSPNMGRGGYELAQLQQQQKLRQEAQQRAATRPIEEAGIKLKQYTSMPDGIDPNQSPDKLATALAAPGVDRSQLGTAEQSLVRGEEQKTRELQQTQEDLNNQRSQDVSQIAGGVASTGTKALGSEMENQLTKERTNTFVNTG